MCLSERARSLAAPFVHAPVSLFDLFCFSFSLFFPLAPARLCLMLAFWSWPVVNAKGHCNKCDKDCLLFLFFFFFSSAIAQSLCHKLPVASWSVTVDRWPLRWCLIALRNAFNDALIVAQSHQRQLRVSISIELSQQLWEFSVCLREAAFICAWYVQYFALESYKFLICCPKTFIYILYSFCWRCSLGLSIFKLVLKSF